MPHPKDNQVKISGSNINIKKTYKEFQEQVLEKTLSPEDIDDLIDKSIEGVTAIKNDEKRNKEDVSTAKSVLKWLQGVCATFEKEGSLHPSGEVVEVV